MKEPLVISSRLNARRVLIGVTRVDNQRQACFTGGGDVAAEARFLILAAASLMEMVEIRLTNRDDARISCAK